MEIYTGDLIDVAQECAANISKKINNNDYFIEDECCELQHKIRKLLYERLSIAFNDLIEREKNEDIEHAYLKDELKNKLFKIINEL